MLCCTGLGPSSFLLGRADQHFIDGGALGGERLRGDPADTAAGADDQRHRADHQGTVAGEAYQRATASNTSLTTHCVWDQHMTSRLDSNQATGFSKRK